MFESTAGSGTRFWEAVDDPDTLQRYREFIALADCGLYQVDSSGRFVAVNETLLTQTGYASDDLLGEHVSTLLDDDDVDRIGRARRDSLDAGTTSLDPFEISIETAHGEQLPFELRLNLLVDNGDRRGSIGAVHERSAAGRDSDRIASAGESIDPITTVLDEANIGVFVLDEEFEVAWIDETVEEYFGLDRDSVIGRDKRRLVEDSVKYRFPNPDRFAETVLATYDDNSYIERFECRIMAGADRDERWLEHYSKPIESGEYEGGRIELYYDITDRKQSEESRQETEQRFHSLVDAVEEYAIFRLDEDGYVTSWNEGANAIKGYDRTEILGEHFSTFYTDEDRAANVPQQNLDAAVESGSVEDEGWRVRKDGSRFYANVTITAIRDDGGAHQGFLKVTRDMTDRYERERELEGELQRIFGRISDGFYALDEDCQFTHINERAEQILEVDGEELLGANVWTAFPEIQDTAFEEHYREAMTTQESVAFEGYYPPNDAWYETHAYPSETGLSVYFRDVTERRERERELQQAERRFEATFEDPNILVGLLDPNGTVLDINQTAMEYVDADLSDVTGDPFWETPWWGDGDGVQCDVKEWTERAIAGEYVDFEADLTRANGDHYTLSGYFRPVMNDDGDVVSIIVSDRDVTERKEREQRLEQRAMQQQIVADLGQLALETDDIDDLMHEAASQVADALDNEYCKVLDLDDERDELLLRQGVGWRDGIVGEAAVSAVEVNSQAAYTLANDHPIVVEDLDTESRFSGPDLLTNHDVCSGISTVIGPFDEAWGILGTHDTDPHEFTEEDVTFVQSIANVLAEAIERYRYQEELEELIAELEESNERLEQFAYAASHDLQEPLRMVSSYLQLIEQRYEDELDQDGQEFLEFAVGGADRMREMIDGLLEYSRVETQGNPFEPVDLDTVLDDVRDDLQLSIEKSDAEVTTEELPTVEGDLSQLRQVFLNLLDNAIEYSGDEPPRIHVSAEQEGTEWIISVRDEGTGIDPADTDRVFEVFESLYTNDEHAGTGIGLALCERIVERHGGTIWVESEPSEGSTFSFTLPTTDE